MSVIAENCDKDKAATLSLTLTRLLVDETVSDGLMALALAMAFVVKQCPPEALETGIDDVCTTIRAVSRIYSREFNK